MNDSKMWLSGLKVEDICREFPQFTDVKSWPMTFDSFLFVVQPSLFCFFFFTVLDTCRDLWLVWLHVVWKPCLYLPMTTTVKILPTLDSPLAQMMLLLLGLHPREQIFWHFIDLFTSCCTPQQHLTLTLNCKIWSALWLTTKARTIKTSLRHTVASFYSVHSSVLVVAPKRAAELEELWSCLASFVGGAAVKIRVALRVTSLALISGKPTTDQ